MSPRKFPGTHTHTDALKLLPSRLNTLTTSLQKDKTPPLNDCPGYDTKQSDAEVPVMLELWRIRGTLSLPSLPGPLRPGVIEDDKIKTKNIHAQQRNYYISGTYNPNLIELILKSVLMYLNVFSYWRYLNSKSKRYTIQQYRRSSYKVVMYFKKIHHFCNTYSPDDGPKLGRKYLRNN